MKAKIRNFFLAISGIAAVVYYFFRVFKSAPKTGTDAFPLADEKAAAKKDVAQIKDEIKKLDDKVYTDEEIEKKFNK